MEAIGISPAQRLARDRDAFLGSLTRCRALMGILNVTPDSFSDGGRFCEVEGALEHARAMLTAGADIIDIGAESTRPGHVAIAPEEELRRLRPVLGRLVEAIDAPFSIDTYKAATARFALEVGCCVVNDIWGLQKDPTMAEVIAEAGAAVVVMHNREETDEHINIVDDLKRFFDRSLIRASRAGIPESHILLDPGIGFGKTKDQNLRALRATDELAATYRLPILIGVSRKSLFGALLDAEVDARLLGTLATNLACAVRGARVFRVHDVSEHRTAMTVLDAIDHA